MRSHSSPSKRKAKLSTHKPCMTWTKSRFHDKKATFPYEPSLHWKINENETASVNLPINIDFFMLLFNGEINLNNRGATDEKYTRIVMVISLVMVALAVVQAEDNPPAGPTPLPSPTPSPNSLSPPGRHGHLLTPLSDFNWPSQRRICEASCFVRSTGSLAAGLS